MREGHVFQWNGYGFHGYGEFIYAMVIFIQERCAPRMAVLDAGRVVGLPPSSKRKRQGVDKTQQVPTPGASDSRAESATGNKTFTCAVCSKQFGSLKTMNLHRDVHYGPDAKKTGLSLLQLGISMTRISGEARQVLAQVCLCAVFLHGQQGVGDRETDIRQHRRGGRRERASHPPTAWHGAGRHPRALRVAVE